MSAVESDPLRAVYFANRSAANSRPPTASCVTTIQRRISTFRFADRRLDLGFELGLEPVDVGSRRDTVAQRHVQRFCMGAGFVFVDTGRSQAVDIGEAARR